MIFSFKGSDESNEKIEEKIVPEQLIPSTKIGSG